MADGARARTAVGTRDGNREGTSKLSEDEPHEEEEEEEEEGERSFFHRTNRNSESKMRRIYEWGAGFTVVPRLSRT